MKSVIGAIAVVAAGLAVAGMLGVASAEAPTATSARTVSVEGVANVPIAQNAALTAATAAYRQGMAVALADGQSKAEFLASKAGVTLGSVQSIIEGGGSISCTGGDESGYVEYQGEQPDFGSPEVSVGPLRAGTVAPTVRKPALKRPKKTSKSPVAGKAAATSCTLTTQVALAYPLD